MKLLPKAVESVSKEKAESFDFSTLVSMIFDVFDKFSIGTYREKFDDILTNYVFGYCAYLAEDFQVAISLLNKVPKDCDLFPYVKYNLAECYFKLNDIPSFGKLLQLVKRGEPTYFHAQLRIIKYLHVLNKMQDFAQRLENLKNESSLPNEIISDTVKFLIEIDDFNNANLFLNKYKDLSLEKMLLHQRLQSSLFSSTPNEFAKFFNKEISHVCLRDVYEICRVYKMAQDLFTKLLQVKILRSKSPDEKDFWISMKAYIEQDVEGCLENLQKVSEKFYSIESVYCLVAFCYAQQDRKQEAVDLLKQIPSSIPEYEIIQYQMFELYISLNNLEEVTKLVSKFPQKSEFYNLANYQMAKMQVERKLLAIAKNRLALVEPNSSVYVRAQILLEDQLYDDYETDPEIEAEGLPAEVNLLTIYKNENEEIEDIKRFFRFQLNRFDKDYKRKLSKKHSIF